MYKPSHMCWSFMRCARSSGNMSCTVGLKAIELSVETSQSVDVAHSIESDANESANRS